MAERSSRAHFLLALLVAGSTFFLLVPVGMVWVLGDRIHAYDTKALFGFDLACTLVVVGVFHAWTQRWWRDQPPRERWRKAARLAFALLVAPVLGVALLVACVHLLVLVLD